jgi:hypothetical protein
VYGTTFNFQQHPIAPVGCKVLTWDSPEHRGTWDDHGVEAVYLGPAIKHLRSFRVWVPNTSAARVTNTVWWFLHDVEPCEPLLDPDPTLAYPPTKARPHPMQDGSDLIGRAFFEPDLGVCLITGLGPVIHNPLSTRARLNRARNSDEPILEIGKHFTLVYRHMTTGDEHYSSLIEVLYWIQSGPTLTMPTVPHPLNATNAPITTPSHASVSIQYLPLEQRGDAALPALQHQRAPDITTPPVENFGHEKHSPQRTTNHEKPQKISSSPRNKRLSQRDTNAPTRLKSKTKATNHKRQKISSSPQGRRSSERLQNNLRDRKAQEGGKQRVPMKNQRVSPRFMQQGHTAYLVRTSHTKHAGVSRPSTPPWVSRLDD